MQPGDGPFQNLFAFLGRPAVQHSLAVAQAAMPQHAEPLRLRRLAFVAASEVRRLWPKMATAEVDLSEPLQPSSVLPLGKGHRRDHGQHRGWNRPNRPERRSATTTSGPHGPARPLPVERYEFVPALQVVPGDDGPAGVLADYGLPVSPAFVPERVSGGVLGGVLSFIRRGRRPALVAPRQRVTSDHLTQQDVGGR